MIVFNIFSSLRLTLRLALFVLFIAAIPTSAQEANVKVSTPEEIKEDFTTVPCEDKKRLEVVKSLFERAGVPSSEIKIDKYNECNDCLRNVNKNASR